MAASNPSSDRAAPPPDGRPPAPRLSKPARITLGLLFTLFGLVLIVILFPSAPGPLVRVLPVAAVGIVAVWLGGVLMGVGSRS